MILYYYYIITQSLGYCKEYPVVNYSIALRLMSDGSLDTLQFVSEPEKSITIDNLSENTLYWFKILVQNDVGTISTAEIEMCELF